MNAQLPPDLNDKRFLGEREVMALTGKKMQTLRNERFRGVGIPYYKLGRSVRYRLSDVLAFMERHRIDPEGGR